MDFFIFLATNFGSASNGSGLLCQIQIRIMKRAYHKTAKKTGLFVLWRTRFPGENCGGAELIVRIMIKGGDKNWIF